MERRENALREALESNVAETERWRQYETENTTAIENLDAFAKHLVVDVMVPVGGKAFMPGQLIHTNEVLVGHYQGYFSKCSAHKAKEICTRRINLATERLRQLSNEADLWHNKLDKPYAEGVLPQTTEREIIEDYDEVAEQRWREEHKERVKQAKLRERAEREKISPAKEEAEKAKKNDKDVDMLQLLEEAELLEELEKELDKLNVEQVDDEMLRQLMAGKMDSGTCKERVAHNLKSDQTSNVIPMGKLQGVVKKTEASKVLLATNNNSQPNPELLFPAVAAEDSDDSNESESELPDEVRTIKDQAKFLPIEDQIGFYDYQIQIIRQKLLTLPMGNQEEVDAKVHQLTVLEHVEELLAIAEETVGAAELAESEAQEEEEEATAAALEAEATIGADAEKHEEKQPQKRRISFALADETLEFRRNETVAQMLPKTTEQTQLPPKRDIIRLNESEINAAIEISAPAAPKTQKSIIEKVEEQRKFVAEHQSAQDFDLVNKILAAATVKTLHISFKHSTAVAADNVKNMSLEVDETPGTPADLYDIYVKTLKHVGGQEQQPTTLFINAYQGEDQVHAPVLREANRQEAYEDPRIAYSIPHKNTETTNSKSILRNKDAVENEARITIGKDGSVQKTNFNKNRKKKPSTPLNEEVYMSAYNKVMHEVVEKPIEAPEPLPEGKYIDAHAPKKRISRFKQMRAEKT